MLHVPLISSTLFDEPFCINSVLVCIFATRITDKPEQRWRRRRNKEEQRDKRRTKEKERKKVRIKEKRK
jgi:hypothetical protein